MGGYVHRMINITDMYWSFNIQENFRPRVGINISVKEDEFCPENKEVIYK